MFKCLTIKHLTHSDNDAENITYSVLKQTIITAMFGIFKEYIIDDYKIHLYIQEHCLTMI